MSNADDARAAAEEAEAEAVEAEALAAAARARARAVKLRRAATAASEAAAEPPPAEPAGSAGSAESSLTEPDEPSVATEAPDEPASPEGVRHGSRRTVLLRIAAATVAIVCSLALLSLGGVMYVAHRNLQSQRQLSAEFAAAARQGVVTLMSLDFNDAKENVQRIIDNTTGDFKKDFEGQAEQFVKVAQDSKVVTEANVNAVAVQSMTKNTATVLVTVVTTVSNKASSAQDPRSWRLSVDVARDGDQVKLSKVEFVP